MEPRKNEAAPPRRGPEVSGSAAHFCGKYQESHNHRHSLARPLPDSRTLFRSRLLAAASGEREHVLAVAARQANCGLHAAVPPPSERLLSEELSPRGLVLRVQLFRPNDVIRGPHTTCVILLPPVVWFLIKASVAVEARTGAVPWQDASPTLNQWELQRNAGRMVPFRFPGCFVPAARL